VGKTLGCSEGNQPFCVRVRSSFCVCSHFVFSQALYLRLLREFREYFSFVFNFLLYICEILVY
jgi:hypothetical protein